ncbi:hypothetical protein WICPIJ_007450 [Wickerhamomyces pijperi]|uniref:F-box domain-containing protein n=1 Tax=Wickerhamomyces pijperi TaxID=599730 RepID=A0A9P8TKE8_WICPI|nr:hypothetical protein WICPIJ_007450 [Wickerhamomyces pijperi]
MANKRRPKKTKPPYRRYGPDLHGLNSMRKEGEGDYANSDDEITLDSLIKKSKPVELKQERMTLWPVSQFEKVDVLKFAILCETIRRGDTSSIPQDLRLLFKDQQRQYQQQLQQRFPEMVFPLELWILILNFLPASQPELLTVCRAFFQIYVPILYADPQLNAHNFFPFVESLTNSRKRQYGFFVHRLDLSPIIQSGKNSYVSKVLRRCSTNLRTFVAPQTSFGYAPLVSLHGCTNIRVLDLSLVSETVKLKELFHAIENAMHLTHLSFPRSSIQCEGYEDAKWPPGLQYLRLSGGITDEFLINSKLPSSITKLEFAHCPIVSEFAIYNFLSKCGDSLQTLSIQYPMPNLKHNGMDFLFTYCPNLLTLQIPVDYVTRFLFADSLLPLLPNNLQRPIHTIYIESSGALGQSSKLHPDDLILAIYEDRLPCLKWVSVTSKLGWVNLASEDTQVLAGELEERGGGLFLNHH